jgi:hypothetical protein
MLELRKTHTAKPVFTATVAEVYRSLLWTTFLKVVLASTKVVHEERERM